MSIQSSTTTAGGQGICPECKECNNVADANILCADCFSSVFGQQDAQGAYDKYLANARPPSFLGEKNKPREGVAEPLGVAKRLEREAVEGNRVVDSGTPTTTLTPPITPTLTPPSGDSREQRESYYSMKDIQATIEWHKQNDIDLPKVEIHPLPSDPSISPMILEVAERVYIDMQEILGAREHDGFGDKLLLYGIDAASARTGLPKFRIVDILKRFETWGILKESDRAAPTSRGKGCRQYQVL